MGLPRHLRDDGELLATGRPRRRGGTAGDARVGDQAEARAADALFDLADALLTDPSAQSFSELSLAPSSRRTWSSLYEALEDGRIDRSALLRELVTLMPIRLPRKRPVLGLDTSSILRPEAQLPAKAPYLGKGCGR